MQVYRFCLASISQIANRNIQNSLWFLSPELSALEFFNQSLSNNSGKQMVEYLRTYFLGYALKLDYEDYIWDNENYENDMKCSRCEWNKRFMRQIFELLY